MAARNNLDVRKPLSLHQMLTQDSSAVTARIGSIWTNESNASHSIHVGVIITLHVISMFLYSNLLLYLNGSVYGN